MDVVYRCCCGLDVHKDSVVACVLWAAADGKHRQEKRKFGTFTRELLELSDWLGQCGVTHVVMESTGVYWKPVWHVLEAHFELLLANAQHVKGIPGKKTDRRDAAWLAELLQHGLLRGSFVPPEPIRGLRDLTRYRVSLAQECNRIANRIQKVLEDANIKLASVATDPLGVSGRAMLKAIVQGEQQVETLAEMSRGLLRRKIPQLQLALEGRVTDHHRFLLKELLDHLEFVEAKMKELEKEIAVRLRPYADQVQRLCGVPGIDRVSAWASSQRSVWTCSSSLMRNTWPVGRGCVRGTGKVPASARVGGRAREALGCGGICANRHGVCPPNRTTTYPHCSAAWRLVAASSGPP